MVIHKLIAIGTLASVAVVSLADSNDFANPKYIIAAKDDPGTRDARSTIIRSGRTSAKKGPWTITNSDIRAATGDPRDYLSWAPYHWPDCNWCGRTNSVDNQPSSQDRREHNPQISSHTSKKLHAPDYSPDAAQNLSTSLFARLRRQTDHLNLPDALPDSNFALELLDMMGDLIHYFIKVERRDTSATKSHLLDSKKSQAMEAGQPATLLAMTEMRSTNAAPLPVTASGVVLDTGEDSKKNQLDIRDLALLPTTASPSMHAGPTNAVQATPTPPRPSTSSPNSTPSPSDPQELPLRAHKPTKTKSCTSSPSTSMPPSATWTACPYKPRDGRVNPDVRDIRSAKYFNEMSQSVVWNAVAAVTSGSMTHAKYMVTFIDTFFLDGKTRMNPNVGFGQVVRGPPGTQSGSYMGILDLRALVKIVNAILVFQESNNPYWTQDRDVKMKAWVAQYIQWIETSPVGKKAGRASNNHGSFYPNQLAALKILCGDIAGARAVLQSYFDKQFRDQIVASGEQPLEAVRTRPFHYRCFNLEAIITNAKLGDYLGMNFWDSKTKYGATIQTAVDYLMTLDPGDERLEEALPHVAAIAAVYGDPHQKYAAYLKSGNPNYVKKPFWFYNQPRAISSRPTITGRGSPSLMSSNSQSSVSGADSENPEGDAQAMAVDQDHPPTMFANGQLVELEEGLFVGWKDVREFYRKVERRHIPKEHRRMHPRSSLSQQEPAPPAFQDEKVELEEGLEIDWDDISSFYGPKATPS